MYLCSPQGCLKPVKITIPPGCILDPLDGAAVIGGNVLTCQRVVDVVFKAFQVCAASQVCVCVCVCARACVCMNVHVC